MSEDGSTLQDPIINITGQKVALGPVRRDVLPLWLKWENDFEVTRTEGGRLNVMTRERLEKIWDEASREGIRFLVYELPAMRPIGTTNLAHIDRSHRTAEFGISIGERDCWGKGYGTEATVLTLDYAFTGLGLHNVVLNVVAYNERGIRTYRRAGFREVGRRRQAWWFGGQAHDVFIMDCLATEFSSPVLRRYLPERTGTANT